MDYCDLHASVRRQGELALLRRAREVDYERDEPDTGFISLACPEKEKNMHIVVTRHPALVDLLIERGLVENGTPVISHATPEQVLGKDVIGVLPYSLAMLANSVTEIPLALTPEMRGQELDLATLREIAGEAVTYKVIRQ